ncbi:MAG: hypothetical protein L6407_00460, partial [Candidatus Delongbacteria bacterium]|nr:hypothetical protein [Candidatus Delongbacteria bacterium]
MVNTICQTILGTGVVSFAKGKDGGKDGRFIGTAQHFPSSNAPWSGKFIIQSKHTSTPTASCSDSDFNTIVKDEIKKIQALIEKDEVDNYLLFTNRKYTGVVGDEIRNRIICETGLQNVAIIGNETINNQYLNSHKNIVRQYGLNQLHIPFDFSDDEIKKIILVFKYQLPVISDEIKAAVNKLKYDYSHIEKDLKNQKNKLSVSYYQDEILSKSLMEFQKIEAFLNNPINSELKDYYFDT